MIPSTRDRGIRALLAVAALSGGWAIAVLLTGGFAIESHLVRVSSRSPRNPLILATLSMAAAWLVAPRPRRRHWLAQARSRIRAGSERALEEVSSVPVRTAPVIAAVAVVAILIVAVAKGTGVAGGGDSYGYASQADLWARGRLRVEQPLMDQVAWPRARDALAPLGYSAANQGPFIVPVYAPGLPLVMALFALAAGRPAVFYAVPVLGAAAVWATYVMGRRLAGRAVGAAAAVLLATSPAFLYQVVQPMSDVPAAAWWAIALALLLVDTPFAVFMGGMSAGAATLTRPNLVPILPVVIAFLAWMGRARPSGRHALLFVAGALPGCLVVSALNAFWFGSPFRTGYGSFDYLYQASNVWPNLARYPRWLLESETPIILLALAAPFLLPRAADVPERTAQPRSMAILWLVFSVTLFACYAFYAPFDAWWYVRFLLPAFPPLVVLTASVIVAGANRMAGRAGPLVAAAIVAAAGWHGVRYAMDRSAFDLKEGERKYVAVGRYIATHLPAQSVFFAVQHTGSIRYYSDRLTIRFDLIDPQWLDRAIEDLRSRGYRPYIVLDDEEAAQFRDQFAAHTRVGTLAWPPIARLARTPGVNIYDPADATQTDVRDIAVDVIPMNESAASAPRQMPAG